MALRSVFADQLLSHDLLVPRPVQKIVQLSLRDQRHALALPPVIGGVPALANGVVVSGNRSVALVISGKRGDAPLQTGLLECLLYRRGLKQQPIFMSALRKGVAVSPELVRRLHDPHPAVGLAHYETGANFLAPQLHGRLVDVGLPRHLRPIGRRLVRFEWHAIQFTQDAGAFGKMFYGAAAAPTGVRLGRRRGSMITPHSGIPPTSQRFPLPTPPCPLSPHFLPPSLLSPVA